MTDIKEAQGLEVVAWRIGFPNNAGYKVYGQQQPWAYEQYGTPPFVTYEVQDLCRLSDATAVIDQLRERVAELEAKWRTEHDTANAHIMAHDAVRAELAALKSAPVVMPDRRIQALAGVSLFDLGHAKGWNACLDELARLNRSKT